MFEILTDSESPVGTLCNLECPADDPAALGGEGGSSGTAWALWRSRGSRPAVPADMEGGTNTDWGWARVAGLHVATYERIVFASRAERDAAR